MCGDKWVGIWRFSDLVIVGKSEVGKIVGKSEVGKIVESWMSEKLSKLEVRYVIIFF